MNVDILVVLAFLGALGLAVTYAANALRVLKKWVRKTAASSERAEEQLTTESGVPIAVQIERTAVSLDRINLRLDEQDRRLDTQAATVRETHDLAVTAIARATDVRDRLDHHLVRDHGAQPAPTQE
jgi:site-specific recombinase